MSKIKKVKFNIIYIIFFYGVFNFSFGQIGINTITPNENTVLDIFSTDKGVLFPRLTNSDRLNITNPVAGLLIYNTSKNCLEWYNGSNWQNLCGIIDNVPAAPSNVIAESGNAQATVSFSVSNSDFPVTSFMVTSIPDGITSSGSASPITITGLNNGTAYTFTVTATSSVGVSNPSSPSNSITPSVPNIVPEAPINLIAVPQHTKVQLSWSAPNNATVADYIIEYRIKPLANAPLPYGPWIALNDGISNTTTTTISDLTNKMDYEFRVSAINNAGTSPFSNVITSSPVSQIIATLPSTLQTIAINDSNIFFTPGNWVLNGSNFASTNSPGAYLKMGFTGTSFAINVNTTSGFDFPKIAYSIDGGPLQRLILPSQSASLKVNLTPTLLPSGSHQISIYLDGLGRADRWNTPSDQLKINSFIIDQNATAIAPTLRTKRMLLYGDSISEGSGQLVRNGVVAHNQWSTGWTKLLSDALDAEITMAAYQGSGYNYTGAGNVPGVLTGWNLIRNGVTRTFINFDYVVIWHGQNGTPTQSEITTTLTNLRGAIPNSKIFLGVPFSGKERSIITSSFNSQSDANVFLIDTGLTGTNVVSNPLYTSDGLHPNTLGHSLLAPIVAQLILANL
jgi:hypothetical protein